MRSTLAGAFMAGGMFGSVLGMALGGVLAQHLGWRWAFAGMALFGLLLAVLYPMIVKEARIAPSARSRRARPADRCVACTAAVRLSPPTSAAACNCSSVAP